MDHVVQRARARARLLVCVCVHARMAQTTWVVRTLAFVCAERDGGRKPRPLDCAHLCEFGGIHAH